MVNWPARLPVLVNTRATRAPEVEGSKVNGNDFFSPWEGDPINGWDKALEEIETVIARAGPNRTVAWRGHVNATWSLHSSLYRCVLDARTREEPPKEEDLLQAEKRVADAVRERWRFDHMPYLELMANLQHFRGPTRLLDVSLNPLVALWFAVERTYDEEDAADGRLFAFDVSTRRIKFGDWKWSDYHIPWRERKREDGTIETRWCRELPLLWRPPSYNDRIPAQHSGFLLAGVPKFGPGGNMQYRMGPGAGAAAVWKVAEVRRATSVPTRMVTRGRKPHSGSEPTMTLRISAEAKAQIRARLEKSFGLNPSTMYPDLFGMAYEISREIKHASLLTGGRR